MTKAEIIEMMKDMDDNQEVAVVMKSTDRDGIRYHYKETNYLGVVRVDAEPVAKCLGNPLYVKED